MIISALLAVAVVSAADFPRIAGEADDAPRLQRAVEAASPYGTVRIPPGLYEMGSTLYVTNRASLELDKSAILRAVRPMDFVVVADYSVQWAKPADYRHDFGFFLRGGQIDGNGLASGLSLEGYRHFTLANMTFLNGKVYGLCIDRQRKSYELVANNLYFRTFVPGLRNNVALCMEGGDSHFTDCIVVDYSIGFKMSGGSNRLTRCHVWVGPLTEKLEESVNYDLAGTDLILRDCYADTGKVGFRCHGEGMMRLLGCQYYNNHIFKLDNITIIDHASGDLLVADAEFVKTCDHLTLYRRGKDAGRIAWRDNAYINFKELETPGNVFAK